MTATETLSAEKKEVRKPAKPKTLPDGSPIPLQEESLFRSFDRVRRRIVIQSWILLALAPLLPLILPFTQPIYHYYSMNPNKEYWPMAGLDMPNITNRAILSWATVSVTEVMTMGFGDISKRMPQQRNRFTDEGWDAYMKMFDELKIKDTFKQSQLIMTTVPSNMPVIIKQGLNRDRVYQWDIEMPIIMTYATNNNVTTGQRGMAHLSIIRVPTVDNFAGIAINKWFVR